MRWRERVRRLVRSCGLVVLLLGLVAPTTLAEEGRVIPLWPEGVPDARPGGGVERLSVETRVSRDTPPTFLVHTAEDTSVPLENSLLFFQALRRGGVPVEMHLYEKGPHGFGTKPGLGPTSEWPKRLEEWMRSHGWLAPIRWQKKGFGARPPLASRREAQGPHGP